jgi:hypothetical protein
MNKSEKEQYIEAVGQEIFPNQKGDKPFSFKQLETIRLSIIKRRNSEGLTDKMVSEFSAFIKEKQRNNSYWEKKMQEIGYETE